MMRIGALWQSPPAGQAAMRATMLGLALGLAGCSHLPWNKPPPAEVQVAPPMPVPQPAPPAPTEAAHARPKAAAEPAHKETPARRPSEPQVAMIDPNGLVGKRPAAVEGLLGKPNAKTKDEMSLVWHYEAEGCSLKVYFYPDLKTSHFHVLKFSLAGADGKALDDTAPCRRKLLAMRKHDTG